MRVISALAHAHLSLVRIIHLLVLGGVVLLRRAVLALRGIVTANVDVSRRLVLRGIGASGSSGGASRTHGAGGSGGVLLFVAAHDPENGDSGDGEGSDAADDAAGNGTGVGLLATAVLVLWGVGVGRVGGRGDAGSGGSGR